MIKSLLLYVLVAAIATRPGAGQDPADGDASTVTTTDSTSAANNTDNTNETDDESTAALSAAQARQRQILDCLASIPSDTNDNTNLAARAACLDVPNPTEPDALKTLECFRQCIEENEEDRTGLLQCQAACTTEFADTGKRNSPSFSAVSTNNTNTTDVTNTTDSTNTTNTTDSTNTTDNGAKGRSVAVGLGWAVLGVVLVG